MKRFIEGEARTQVTLLPECLDDYVTEENPVRVVDDYVKNNRMDRLKFLNGLLYSHRKKSLKRKSKAFNRMNKNHKS